MSTCLAGLCAVWNYACGLGPHLLWISCNCSFGALSLALSPSPSLSLSFSLALWPSSFFFLFFFFLPSVPLFSPCMAHYGWSPPAQSGNCLSVCLHAQHTQTHTQPHSNSAVFRAACRFVGLCTICYKTALLILFGQEVETIVLSHFFLLFSWWKQTVSRLCCGCQSTIFHKALALQP